MQDQLDAFAAVRARSTDRRLHSRGVAGSLQAVMHAVGSIDDGVVICGHVVLASVGVGTP
ncbi:hypothetical protein GCM10025783_25010 [Amnibacterium soli]|uniref:Uncharacterized protein n=1 Tax=Amnibacterium soli TaxID=1282736 RepID=A0ABP8ZAM6_9MICO